MHHEDVCIHTPDKIQMAASLYLKMLTTVQFWCYGSMGLCLQTLCLPEL